MHHMQTRESAIKKETSDLKLLIEANTTLTQENKALAERIETLTNEIHARLPAL
jgi:regulator of replication initiation timing